MPLDRTLDKDRFKIILKNWIDQFAHTLITTDTKHYIEQLVIQPFLEYILEKSFPYMIIGICMFSTILIIVILIFIFLIYQNKTDKSSICSFCDRII